MLTNVQIVFSTYNGTTQADRMLRKRVETLEILIFSASERVP